MDTSPHKSELVNVNGIRLHYLDWGGEGESLLFLTGMGSSAHIFDIIAPRFTDKFRVLALTRRGQGESDRPESGYDVDTLVDDILKFMHTLKIERTILAGHSLAGVELTCFTERHPEKVLKLVYLDAVYDAKGRMETFKRRPLNEIRPPEEKTEFSSVEEYIAYCKYIRPDLAQIWNETFDETAVATIKPVTAIAADDMVMDVGPDTASAYARLVTKAKTIVWNGPLGVFEFESFSHGTQVMAEAIASSGAFSIAGGGDTLAAISKFGISAKLSYISTAGGAFLEFLEGRDLPAISILKQKNT